MNHRVRAPPSESATKQERHQARAPPSKSATKQERHRVRAPPSKSDREPCLQIDAKIDTKDFVVQFATVECDLMI